MLSVIVVMRITVSPGLTGDARRIARQFRWRYGADPGRLRFDRSRCGELTRYIKGASTAAQFDADIGVDAWRSDAALHCVTADAVLHLANGSEPAHGAVAT